jgi:hypothetical protein
MLSSLGRFSRRHAFQEKPWSFDDGFHPRDWLTRQPRFASRPQPLMVILNDPSCYHFRVLDPPSSAQKWQ